MRVTAGRFKGRALAAPENHHIRPTSDKVRQAIFNVLAHHDFGSDFAIENGRVIDLFAGTGALGIEALSRGARYGLFVEDGAEARALVRANVEAFGLTGVTKIWRRNATDLGPATLGLFNLAFLDPPYGKGLIGPALTSLKAGGWLAPGAIAVAEAAEDDDIPPTDGFTLADQRSYGETKVAFLRFGETP